MVMNKKEELLIDLIFGEKSNFTINISDYIDEPYKYDRFIDEVKSILLSSEVAIVSEILELNKNGSIWTIKVKR